jgi:hypothetical protein
MRPTSLIAARPRGTPKRGKKIVDSVAIFFCGIFQEFWELMEFFLVFYCVIFCEIPNSFFL